PAFYLKRKSWHRRSCILPMNRSLPSLTDGTQESVTQVMTAVCNSAIPASLGELGSSHLQTPTRSIARGDAAFGRVGQPSLPENLMFATTDRLFQEYMEPLMSGRRSVCRQLVMQAVQSGTEPRTLYSNLIWPAMEKVDRLYREDQITTATQN